MRGHCKILANIQWTASETLYNKIQGSGYIYIYIRVQPIIDAGKNLDGAKAEVDAPAYAV
jgi:hypothetical protein